MSWPGKDFERGIFDRGGEYMSSWTGDLKKREGPSLPVPHYASAIGEPISLIALLFLVEPVLRTGEILRPVTQMNISPPCLRVPGLPPGVRRVPGKIPLPFPWPPV